MKVIITGSTGMVGKGVLLICLEDPRVTEVLAVNRQNLEIKHAKLKELIIKDFYTPQNYAHELKGYDACFFCLGVSSVGMNETDYSRVTYDLTTGFAKAFLAQNPKSGFIYVSGTGTDSSEKGSTMWARVKGKTENALLAMNFSSAYMFRPGFIQPMRGIKSKTKLYQSLYNVVSPMYPVLNRLFPKFVTNTDKVGMAMLNAITKGYNNKWLENHDINTLAGN